jgi:hypothetical protein
MMRPDTPAFSAALAALALSMAAPPASAHHSAAMYDRAHPRTLEGTVKAFEWANPHVWIQLVVANDEGGSDAWGVECTSVNFMTRRGWSRDTLKPGDKVTVVISPLRDGSRGGAFQNLTGLNGQPFKTTAEE